MVGSLENQSWRASGLLGCRKHAPSVDVSERGMQGSARQPGAAIPSSHPTCVLSVFGCGCSTGLWIGGCWDAFHSKQGGGVQAWSVATHGSPVAWVCAGQVLDNAARWLSAPQSDARNSAHPTDGKLLVWDAAASSVRASVSKGLRQPQSLPLAQQPHPGMYSCQVQLAGTGPHNAKTILSQATETRWFTAAHNTPPPHALSTASTPL